MPKARPATIKWDGVGWYSALAALLAFLVLLAVAIAAYDLAQKVDEQVQRAALERVAREAPLAICPNATMHDVEGIVSSSVYVFVGVFNDTNKDKWCLEAKQLPIAYLIKDEPAFLLKLHKCGVLKAWYSARDIQDYLNGTLKWHPADQPLLEFLRSRGEDIYPENIWNFPELVGYITHHLNVSDFDKGTGFMKKYLVETDDLVKTDYYFPNVSKRMEVDNFWPSQTHESIWVLYDIYKGKASKASAEGFPHVWFVITQTDDTTTCLATVLHTTGLEREGTPRYYYSKETVRGGTIRTNHTWGEGGNCKGPKRVWFEPAFLTMPYYCTRGVLGSERQRLDAQIQFAKSSTRLRFMGIPNQGYDDVYALYTAAMGAVFGAWATLLGILAAMLVAVCWNCALCLSTRSHDIPIARVPLAQRVWCNCNCNCSRVGEAVRCRFKRVHVRGVA